MSTTVTPLTHTWVPTPAASVTSSKRRCPLFRYRRLETLLPARSISVSPALFTSASATPPPFVVPFGLDAHPFTALITERVPIVLVDTPSALGSGIDYERQRLVERLGGVLLHGSQGNDRSGAHVQGHGLEVHRPGELAPTR